MIMRHYDKIIVVCGFAFLFVNMGLASTAFSVHQPYIVAIEDVGDTGGSLILSVRTGVSLIAMIFVNRYYDLFDVRVGVFVATLLTAMGFVVYSLANTLWQFMGGAILLGLGYGFGGMIAITFIANRWFASGLGTMVGIATMGSGLATIVMPLIVVQIIHEYSLSRAFLVEGSIAAVIAFFMLVLLRNRPSDFDLDPYDKTTTKQKKPKPKAHFKRRRLEAPRRAHLLLMVAMVGVGIYSCVGVTYISVLATSNDFHPILAALLVSIAGIALTVAKPICGELFDRLGDVAGTIIMFMVGLSGYGLCCLAMMGSQFVMIAGAILLGAGLSLGSVGVSIWSIDLSSPAAREREIKNFQISYALGAFIANTCPGILKDSLGNYEVAYAMALILGALAAIIIVIYYRKYTVTEKLPKA